LALWHSLLHSLQQLFRCRLLPSRMRPTPP
jgi:hypothetical protein